MIFIPLLLAGCATPPAPTPEALHANSAVKERYWAIQEAQRNPRVTKVPILLPERVEDGAKRVPKLIELEFP